jgi:DNA-binding NtrC family response regulator
MANEHSNEPGRSARRGAADARAGQPVWIQLMPEPLRTWVLRPGDQCVISADAGADLQVADSSPRRQLCQLDHRGSHLELEDLGAPGGVRIGGAWVQRARLPLEGVFQVGQRTVCVGRAAGGEPPHQPLPGMVGTSALMQRLAALVRRSARLRVPVLLLGDSGTGKDLVARAVHAASPVAAGPFVAINGATLSGELAGSELFGHRRGAFTGAAASRLGAFRRADGGTLFIDEVASLPHAVQGKLLRVVEDGAVTPVGGDEPRAASVRLVTATCEPLDDLVLRRVFRADLYQRLATCVIRLPPLRERRSDIPALAGHLLAASELGPHALAPGALDELQRYAWPGNVRELRNVLLQAAMRTQRGFIDRHDIAAVLDERASGPVRHHGRLSPAAACRLVLEAGGNVSAAARLAGMPRSTFRDRLAAAQREHPGAAPTGGRVDAG